MCRFKTEQDARDHAREASRGSEPVYVIESPPRDREHMDKGNFVVDTDGFVRTWERTVALYEDGEEQPLV